MNIKPLVKYKLKMIEKYFNLDQQLLHLLLRHNLTQNNA
jgi:hypothetical protein